MADVEPREYDIHFEERTGYLYARVSGPLDTVATSLAYWNDIAEDCRRRKVARVLVVEDFVTPAPLTDTFRVAEQLPSIMRGIRVAFVDTRLEHYTANKFGEDVAVNRGLDGMVFIDEDSATRWITA